MRLREAIEQFVPDGFRDEDGVWHEGPHRQAALDELTALLDVAEAAQKIKPVHRSLGLDAALGRLQDAMER